MHKVRTEDNNIEKLLRQTTHNTHNVRLVFKLHFEEDQLRKYTENRDEHINCIVKPTFK